MKLYISEDLKELISNMIIVFSSSGLKLAKQRIAPKFKAFLFYMKKCNFTILRVLVSIMTIVVHNCSQKILK